MPKLKTFYALLVAGATFSAMATTPAPNINPTIKLAPGNDFHCTDTSSGNPKRYADCRDIPIVIIWDAQGKCQALAPYHDLKIHTKNKSRTVVKWKIIGPPDYKFVASTDGVILKPNPTGPLPDNVFNEKVHENPQVYRIVVKTGAPNGSFDHFPAVVDPTDPLNNCGAPDPVVSNLDN